MSRLSGPPFRDHRGGQPAVARSELHLANSSRSAFVGLPAFRGSPSARPGGADPAGASFPGQPGPAGPSSAGEAVRMALAGLGWLAGADAAGVPVPVLAECLRGLEQALAVHTAARARILGSFTARRGFEDDGQGSPRTWLTRQTRVTPPAAGAAVSRLRRPPQHPALPGTL